MSGIFEIKKRIAGIQEITNFISENKEQLAQTIRKNCRKATEVPFFRFYLDVYEILHNTIPDYSEYNNILLLLLRELMELSIELAEIFRLAQVGERK